MLWAAAMKMFQRKPSRDVLVYLAPIDQHAYRAFRSLSGIAGSEVSTSSSNTSKHMHKNQERYRVGMAVSELTDGEKLVLVQ